MRFNNLFKILIIQIFRFQIDSIGSSSIFTIVFLICVHYSTVCSRLYIHFPLNNFWILQKNLFFPCTSILILFMHVSMIKSSIKMCLFDSFIFIEICTISIIPCTNSSSVYIRYMDLFYKYIEF